MAPALDGHRVQEAITMVRILYPRTLLMWVRQPVYYTFITPGSVSLVLNMFLLYMYFTNRAGYGLLFLLEFV